MAKYKLAYGMHLVVNGREYVIEGRLPDGDLQLRDIVTNVCTGKSQAALLDLLFSDQAELLGNDRSRAELDQQLKKTKISDLTVLAEDDPLYCEFERRRDYVMGLMNEAVTALTKENLEPLIDRVGITRGDIPLIDYQALSPRKRAKATRRPSWATLARWVQLYLKYDNDSRVLVPAIKSRGNRTRKFCGSGSRKLDEAGQARAEKVAALIDQAIDEVYLSDQRLPATAVYDSVILKIADENVLRDANDQLPEPHLSSVYDAVERWDSWEVLEARYGKDIAEEEYRAKKQGPRPTRPLERVEADATKTDFFVVDTETLLPVGRLWLTYLICVFTKLILGFYLSFDPPSTLTILGALKHAIKPKTYVPGQYPDIRHSWDAYGIPEKLVVDNAMEHHGRHLELACQQLGINLQYSPKGKPWYRNSVERGIKTINTQLFHRLPGTSFSNILSRADYNPYKHAIIPANTADEIVHKYVIDVYQHSPHRGIMGVPALRWERGIAKWPPSLPAKASDLDFVLSHSERRVISPSGIELDCLLYNDDRLALLRSEAKANDKGNPEVDVKRYGRDLSKIGVHDGKRDRYLTVHAVDQDYTRGLTIWQHKIIRKYVRKQLKEDVNIVSLCRAKQEIQEVVEREWRRVKTSRARMARFRGEGVQNRQYPDDNPQTKDFPQADQPLNGDVLIAGSEHGDANGISDIGATPDIHGSRTGASLIDGPTQPAIISYPGETETTPATESITSLEGDLPGALVSEEEADLEITGWDVTLDLPK